MCYLVLVGVRDHRHSLLVSEMTSRGFVVDGTRNPTVLSVFPARDVVSAITYGMCSCDIYASRRRAFDEQAARRKYEKKGWSAAKIERAISARRPRERERFAAFRTGFAELVRSAGSARILAHCFSGLYDTEPVVLQGRETLRLEDYLANVGEFETDRIYDVVAG